MIDFQSVPNPDSEVRQRLRDGVLLVARDVDERAQEVVPVQDEREQADGDQDRPDERSEDLEEDPDVAGAVDDRRLVEVPRDGHQELPAEEDVERAAAEERRAR